MPEHDLLPLEILQQQVCSKCEQYLTVLPIVKNERGDVICGRHEDEGTPTMLNKVMDNYSFHCINHYEGCQQVLNTHTSREHEQECHIQKAICLFCTFSSNWSGLLQHIILNHPLNIVKDEAIQFRIQKQFVQTYIYPIKDSIYKVRVEINSKKLIVSISNAAQRQLVTDKIMVNFFFGLIAISENLILGGEMEEVVIKDLDELGIIGTGYCRILINQVELTQKEIDLSRKFASLYVSQQQKLDMARKKNTELVSTIEEQGEILEGFFNLRKYISMIIKCSACNVKITENMFVCPNNHFLCQICLHTLQIRFCSPCQSTCKFTKIDNFEKIKVNCDWSGCNIQSSLTEYVEHKKKCSKRPYICPDENCTQTLFSIPELEKHEHFQLLKVTNSYSFADILSTTQFFLLHDTEVYDVSIQHGMTNNELMCKKVDVVDDNKVKLELTSSQGKRECPGVYLDGKTVFSYSKDDTSYKLYFED